MSNDLSEKSLTESTLSGLFWRYASVFGQALLGLSVVGVLARLLSPEDFGLIGIALIFLNLSIVFSQLGVGPAIVQRPDLTEAHVRTGLTFSILIGVFSTLLFCALAPLIASFFHNPSLKDVIYGVSPCFCLVGLGVVAESLLERELKFKELMWLEFGSYALGYAPVGITLAFLGYGVWALVGAILAKSLIKSVSALALRPHAVLPLLRLQELRELLHFGGGIALASFFNIAATQGDSIVVGRVLDASSLGIFSRAYQLMMLPSTYFATVLQKVMFPVMAKVQSDLGRLSHIFLVSMSGVGLVSAPLSAFMVISAPEIVEVLLGPKWTGVVIPFRILSLGILFRTGYKIGDSVALATGTVYRRILREFVYATAVIGGAWAGTYWGLTGVAVAVLLAISLNYVLVIAMGRSILKFSWYELLSSQASGVLLAVLVTLVAWPTRYLLDYINTPVPILLAVTILVTLIVLIGIYLLKPTIMGNYGTLILSTIARYLPKHLPFRPILERLHYR